MSDKRFPRFHDFSPAIFEDIREPLLAVKKHAGDDDAVIDEICALKGWPSEKRKRAGNVLITLRYNGLLDKTLTPLGESIASAATAEAAASRFCEHLLKNINGFALIEAIQALNRRAVLTSKRSIKEELGRVGIRLATGATHHLILAMWLACCDVLRRDKGNYSVNDGALKKLIGIDSKEGAELDGLEVAQRLCLRILRRIAITEGTNLVPAKRIFDECLRDYPKFFVEDQMRRKVIEPLESGGWVKTSGLTTGRGAKSGQVQATSKLLGIPVEAIVPGFDAAVPPDLRKRLDTPLTEIRAMLDSASTHDRGLGLELLVLRMILDLSLIPRGFRKRAKSTGGAEVDVVAEGKHLLFSRWMFQCKAFTARANVDIEDVAREVGIAIHAKAHVIAMVSTGGFTRGAYEFANEITSSTHLQFLFVDGKRVRDYLANGATRLIDHVLENAGEVLRKKGEQPLRPRQEGGSPMGTAKDKEPSPTGKEPGTSP